MTSIDDVTGVVTSPGFPFAYGEPPNSTCSWRIGPLDQDPATNLDESFILLVVDYYDLYERLEIFAGDDVTGALPLAYVDARSAIGMLRYGMLGWPGQKHL